MNEMPFCVESEVYAHVAECMEKNRHSQTAWDCLYANYAKQYPELAEEWRNWHGQLDSKVLPGPDDLGPAKGAEATRAVSGDIINLLAKRIPNLVGGSADLAPSTKTLIKDGGDYSANNRAGRNLHFGVREHGMAAICNGMVLHGGLRVFCATFFVFSDYMKGAMRLSAIMKLPLIYVLTHDSIGVGEDGATHQPIEQLAALRATPNIQVIRPCDRHETLMAWTTALTSKLPSCLVLSRQNLQQQPGSDERALKGAYVSSKEQGSEAQIILMGSGSEIGLLTGAQVRLREIGWDARVVSVPSMELFRQQSDEYQEQVLPKAIRRRLAVEAGSSMPWYRYVGLDGRVVAMDHFGSSAPAEVLSQQYGFTVEHVLEVAEDMLKA